VEVAERPTNGYGCFSREVEALAYNSKALGQFVKGDVNVFLPKDRPVNNPYAGGKGSNFWTYELPELVHRPSEVKSIYVVRVVMENGVLEDKGKIDAAFGAKRKVWTPNYKGAEDNSRWPSPGNPDVEPTQEPGPDWDWPT
jgi:hypothetical protein